MQTDFFGQPMELPAPAMAPRAIPAVVAMGAVISVAEPAVRGHEQGTVGNHDHRGGAAVTVAVSTVAIAVALGRGGAGTAEDQNGCEDGAIHGALSFGSMVREEFPS